MAKLLRVGCVAVGLVAPACCVAAQTRVATARGEVPAGSLAVGDEVWSIDVQTGRRIAASVVAIRRATRECLALRWDGGALVCTPDHPLYAPERGDYRPASDWVTGPARTLLVARAEGVEVVRVTATEVFAGVHEVIDLTLAAEPHNFVAGGVVVHNKSPAPNIANAEMDGPKLELGPGEQARFRVRACLGGEDGGDTLAAINFNGTTSTPPSDAIAAALSVVIEDAPASQGTAAGEVPFEEVVTADYVTCSGGIIVAFSRADAGTGGSIAVEWKVEAHVDRVESGADSADALVLDIVPQPV